MKTPKRFFLDYAVAASGDEPGKIAAFYADDFIVAGPKGSMTFKNDNIFTKWLKDLIRFNRKSGMDRMKVLKVSSRKSGEYYLFVRVKWGVTFSELKDEVISFDIDYVLFKKGEDYRIVMYVSHEDQEELMKTHGLKF